jgi:D-beta-D-heptose 7-phosphate kinase/D-beta-D-heptose 1-phosphate adenosyltransferase
LKLSELLDQIQGVKAVVVGDLMLDEYIFGRATRISPEAPVMVVRHQRTSRVPGGAANVARNMIALGAEARTIGVAGCDEAGNLLENSLIENGFTGALLLRDPARSTTRKTRVLADHTHQVIRIDHEDDDAVSQEIQEKIVAATIKAMQDCSVVVLSDYLKGVLTEAVAQEIIQYARQLGRAVVVNPKPRSLGYYRGANLVSLNRAEASEVLGNYQGLGDQDSQSGAAEILKRAGTDAVLVTLGESGMSAAGPESFFVAAPKVEVYDTAGAGDTVVATVALGLAATGYRREVFELAAQTAGCVVRHVGVATPSVSDLEAIRKM